MPLNIADYLGHKVLTAVLLLRTAKHGPTVHVLKAGKVSIEQSEKGSTCLDEHSDKTEDKHH